MTATKKITALCAALLAAGLAGCYTGPKSVSGEYEVTGSSNVASASITFLQPTSGVYSNAISVTLPWSYDFSADETEANYQGSNVYLSALNNSNNGSVTVTIFESGSIYERSWANQPAQSAITILGNF